jgi:WD40 repeat protein
VCLNNIISCAEKDDTILAIWDFSGSVIDTYDTKQNTNYGFKISPDDKFFAVAAWVADVKVIEMKTARPTGAYAGHAIAMDLKGHKRGLIDLAFNEAANQMATASKDGTVNLFNINVRYNVGEDARLLGSFVPEVEVEFISMMQNCLVVAS